MALRIYDTLAPQGNYPAVKAEHVQMPDGKALSEWEPEKDNVQYVQTVNGKDPDENGNVEVEIPEAEKELPAVSGADNGKVLAVVGGVWAPVTVELPEPEAELPEPTAGDNGKFVAVVNGGYALADPPESGGSGASSITILEETSLNGFTLDSASGTYVVAVSPPPFALTIGETYKVYWDNVEYSVEALDVGQLIPGAAAVGNGSAFGMGGNPDAPFIILQSSEGVSFVALVDYDQPHTVSIYQDDPAATQSYVRSYVEQYISEALGGDY